MLCFTNPGYFLFKVMKKKGKNKNKIHSQVGNGFPTLSGRISI